MHRPSSANDPGGSVSFPAPGSSLQKRAAIERIILSILITGPHPAHISEYQPLTSGHQVVRRDINDFAVALQIFAAEQVCRDMPWKTTESACPEIGVSMILYLKCHASVGEQVLSAETLLIEFLKCPAHQLISRLVPKRTYQSHPVLCLSAQVYSKTLFGDFCQFFNEFH